MAVNAKQKREAQPNFEKELRPTEWNLAELRQVCERHGISAGGVRKPPFLLALNFCGCANPFFGFEAEELEELFWLRQNYTYILAASKNIAIFWLESDTKTQGGVWGYLKTCN